VITLPLVALATMLVDISVEDVMTGDVLRTTADATGHDVATTLEEENIGSLVVCRNGEAVGIVTESDIVALVAQGTDLDAIRVSEFMSEDLRTVAPGASVERAAELLAEHDFRRLPVVDDGDLVGIVTTTDLSYYLPKLGHRHRTSGVDEDRHYSVRPDTTYEQADWEFEARCLLDDHVSVGDIVEFTKTIGDEDVRSFAEASGDTNRLHLEAAYAEQTRFGRRIVHGTLVGGLISAALARLPGVTVYLSQEMSFRAAVDVGGRVTAVCEVTESLGGEKYLLSTEVRGEDGEVVVEGEAVVLVDDLPESATVEAEQLA
jgi:CBS domain-containing protein/acyl dehydratase